jgi:alpha-tubulin suppressor-like RCC1 family protein
LTLIESYQKVKNISAGQQYSLILNQNNKLFTFGKNDGVLGTGNLNNINQPSLNIYNNDINFIKIFANYENTFYINDENIAFGSGNNAQSLISNSKFLTYFNKFNIFL